MSLIGTTGRGMIMGREDYRQLDLLLSKVESLKKEKKKTNPKRKTYKTLKNKRRDISDSQLPLKEKG